MKSALRLVAALALAACAGGTSAISEPPGTDAGPSADAGLIDEFADLDAGSACEPQCAGRECGDDGCGGSCGACEDGATCDAEFQCARACTADCAQRACGSDGCAGSCGTCAAGSACDNEGQCVSSCVPACTSRECGADGCGGSCGVCGADRVCSDAGRCEAVCTPSCSGRACGDDGCGGSCGPCAAGLSCDGNGLCATSCTPSCAGKGCGGDGCGGSCGSCPSGQSCNANGRCVCARPSELIVYSQSGPTVIFPALRDDPNGCTQHWINIPALADAQGNRTVPRSGPSVDAMHAAPGGRFHALAEFGWQAWGNVTNLTWYQKGVEFRRRMAAAGYDTRAGDTWEINELPSTVRSSSQTRRNVMEAIRGLYEGPPGATPIRGVVFTTGMSQAQANLATYKTNVKGWLTDEPFWRAMTGRVRWWAQEVYPSALATCVPNTTVAFKSTLLDDFAEHVAMLSAAGPASANAAQSFLAATYTPTLGAVWKSDGPYGDTRVSLAEMKRYVSLQVASVRGWADAHAYPDGRIGFAWANDPSTPRDQWDALASHLAASIHRGYDTGSRPSAACLTSGTLTGCDCSVAGARANPSWQTFRSW